MQTTANRRENQPTFHAQSEPAIPQYITLVCLSLPPHRVRHCLLSSDRCSGIPQCHAKSEMADLSELINRHGRRQNPAGTEGVPAPVFLLSARSPFPGSTTLSEQPSPSRFLRRSVRQQQFSHCLERSPQRIITKGRLLRPLGETE
jgi:hypothetical protein